MHYIALGSGIRVRLVERDVTRIAKGAAPRLLLHEVDGMLISFSERMSVNLGSEAVPEFTRDAASAARVHMEGVPTLGTPCLVVCGTLDYLHHARWWRRVPRQARRRV